jgi:hypothetical protein
MTATTKPTQRPGTTEKRTSAADDPYPRPDDRPVPAPEPAGPPVPTPTDLTPAQLDAFEFMPPALRARAIEMRTLMRTEMVSLLDSRYELGSILLEVKSDPAKYGPMSDIQLATFFGEAGKTVYGEARRIRERYSPEEFAKIKAAINPANGARISYKHLAILLRLEDPLQAGKALNACLQAGWSTKELEGYVSKKLRELSGPSRKPARSKPSSFFGVMGNVTAVGDEFMRQYDEVWGQGQVLIDAFKALPEEKIDDALVKKLEEARHQSERIAESQQYLAGEISRLMQRAEAVICGRRQGGAARVRIPGGDDVDCDDLGDGESVE